MKTSKKPDGYVRFSVLGEPKGKGRPRFTKNGHTYTPEVTVNYETLVACEYRRQCGEKRFGDDAMIGMRIVACYSIPKSTPLKRKRAMLDGLIRPTKKPDNDNIVKIVEDALNNVAYRDDKNVVDCIVQKYYSEQPKITVEIWNANYSKLKISLITLSQAIISKLKL